jgi:hypothetical protein
MALYAVIIAAMDNPITAYIRMVIAAFLAA